jgi:hypothetical protein
MHHVADCGGLAHVQHTSRVRRLTEAYADPTSVWNLVTSGAPYPLMMSLAGYAMSTADHASMPWFRQYWAVNRALVRTAADEVFRSPRFLETTRELMGTDHVLPYQAMVNLMGPMDTGAAHLDTPTFRSEPLPLWLRLEMGASELFERWRIPVCGAVSWFGYDGPGGEYEYWPEGPDAPSASETPPFDNVAVFGDNDRMFHRVGAIGTPADRLPAGSVSSNARLHHRDDGTWAIVDGGDALVLDSTQLRVSILWTAMWFASAEDLRLMEDGDDLLTLEQVTETFARDLTERGERVASPADPAADPEWVRLLEREYPLPSFAAR